MPEPYVAAVTYGVKPPERLETMHVPDGRTLAWAEWGPPDGLPVVFCTGAAMSRWLGFGADDLTDLGVRLLALDRPGLGASSAHPGKTLDSWGLRQVVCKSGFLLHIACMQLTLKQLPIGLHLNNDATRSMLLHKNL